MMHSLFQSLQANTCRSQLGSPICYMFTSSRVYAILGIFLCFCSTAWAFSPPAVSRTGRSFVSTVSVLKDAEAEFVENMIGLEKYSMVPLPDSMLSTTLFIGNLCEFVQDGDLSNLFRSVSVLNSLPACVARKANTQSLHYGFVAFPTVAEAEAALIRFDGIEWRGKQLRVQTIVDHPRKGRVKVPERLVAYVSGVEKKTRSGETNTLRHSSREASLREKPRKKKKNPKKGRLPSRLTEKEWNEMDRAARRGFLTLVGGGGRHGKASQLKGVHRQWCEHREKPQIVHFKAFGGRAAVDRVLIDLAPIGQCRVDSGSTNWGLDLEQCKAEILAEANFMGMELCSELCEDTADVEECVVDEAKRVAWETSSDVTLGVFEGDRQNAKTMSKALAVLWNIPEKEKLFIDDDSDAVQGGHEKTWRHKKKVMRRKRGGGHRQAW